MLSSQHWHAPVLLRQLIYKYLIEIYLFFTI